MYVIITSKKTSLSNKNKEMIANATIYSAGRMFPLLCFLLLLLFLLQELNRPKCTVKGKPPFCLLQEGDFRFCTLHTVHSAQQTHTSSSTKKQETHI
jgi:hypothetical protein